MGVVPRTKMRKNRLIARFIVAKLAQRKYIIKQRVETPRLGSSEIAESGGFGFKGGDGLDEEIGKPNIFETPKEVAKLVLAESKKGA
jgi:hypothetical protein